ncbi:MAG: hypothetical protein IT380_11210 [Myxococcales bacterium]|nr:hypothetical protein [Myxococcales bacterium]
MRRLLLAPFVLAPLVLAAPVALLSACGGGGGGTGGGGGGGGAGGGGGGSTDPWAIASLDPAARQIDYFAVAFDPTARRVGVVYYAPRGTQTMAGHPDYDIKYVEWNDPDGDGVGAVSPVETIRYVQRKIGLAIAFHPTTGEPTVSYLGGDPGFIMGMSIYWFQSDGVINRRSNGTWTETIVVATGDVVNCGNPVSDRGLLVGLWPALLYDPTGLLFYAYRDGHDAQFPQQDWNGSDVELFEGATGKCVSAGGNNKQAWGGHNQLVMGNGQPAIVYDQMFGTSDTNGSNVVFQERDSAGSWGSPAVLLNISNTQSGPSIAYDSMEGLGVAVVDRATNELSYINRPPGSSTWSSVDPVFGTGSGGWWPSLAMDPAFNEPAIAFYVCSPRNAINETNCLTNEDELRIRQRVAGNWRETVVDKAGGYQPKLGFFVQGTGPSAVSKRVVVYRQPRSIDPGTGLPVTNEGELKIAVER